MGHYQVLTLRVDLGVMAMKGYSTFLKAPDWILTARWFRVITGHSLVSHPTAKLSMYYPVLADKAHSLETRTLETRLDLGSEDFCLNMFATSAGKYLCSNPNTLPGPRWLGVVAPDRVLSIGQIELNCVRILN